MKTLIGICLSLIIYCNGFSQVPNDKNKESIIAISKSDTSYLMDLADKIVGMAIHENQDSLNDHFRELQTYTKRLNLSTIDIYKLLLSETKTESKKVDIQIVVSYFYRTSNSDSALFYGQNALKLARQIKYGKGEGFSLASLGFVHSGLGNYPTALEMQLKGLQIFEKLNIAEGKGLVYERIALNYTASGDYSKALNYLYQSKDIYASINHNTMFTTEQSNIGGAYLKLNQLDSALDYSLKAYDNIRKYKVDFLNPYNLNNLGEIYAKKGETQRALDYYHQALAVSFSDNELNASSLTNYNIAKLFQQINLPDSSIYYAQKALFEAQQGKYYQTMILASTLLSELYESKDTKKALFYSKLTSATQDSLSNLWKNNAYKNITNFDEQERQYEIETAENRIKQYAFLGGLAMLLLVAFILYRNNQQKRKANKILQEQKEKVENTLSQLKSTQAQLIQSEKLASLGELTAGIAHEIQNPLNFVNNFSELSVDLVKDLKEEIEKPTQDKEYIGELFDDLSQNQEKINHHGKRASSIVKGMLEHSRASTGVKELTDINKLADEYLRLSYHGLRAKDKDFNADFTTDFDKNLPKIEVIPQDIGRVLLNLINNAFYAVNERKNLQGLQDLTGLNHYTPSVSVTTQELDNQIIIKVKDNGTGMPESVRAKVFQPFFTTKPTGQGTGLGLSLAYDIVTKGHGGTLEVFSVDSGNPDSIGKGVGSEFIITLPFKND